MLNFWFDHYREAKQQSSEVYSVRSNLTLPSNINSVRVCIAMRLTNSQREG